MMEQRLSIEASIDNLDEVNGFVESHLEEAGCSMKKIMQMSLAVEEVFVNIAHYAYSKKDADGKAIPDTGTGPAEIILNADDSKILLTFIDEGMEYDPLKKEDPDTTLGAEDREIGGLGIFMVKKTMDDVTYRYEGGKNILTLTKMR